MNKLLIALLVFGAGALVYYLLTQKGQSMPDSVPVSETEEVDAEEIGEALKETGERKVYASCNAITNSSTCLEYVGSMWGDASSAELNCANVGKFSKERCPVSPYGGCQTNSGNVMESVLWMYPEGGGGIDAESLPFAQQACNANPMGRWVTSLDDVQ